MKGFFRLVLFAGAVLLLGLIIRSMNRNFGWYEANKVNLYLEPPLEAGKFRIYLAEPFVPDSVNERRYLLPLHYRQMVHDSALVPEFPQVHGENYMVLVYDSVWVFPFIHYKWRAHTQHVYDISITLMDAVPQVEIEITGPYDQYESGPFISLSDSSAYRHLAPLPPDPEEDEEDERPDSSRGESTNYEAR